MRKSGKRFFAKRGRNQRNQSLRRFDRIAERSSVRYSEIRAIAGSRSPDHSNR